VLSCGCSTLVRVGSCTCGLLLCCLLRHANLRLSQLQAVGSCVNKVILCTASYGCLTHQQTMESEQKCKAALQACTALDLMCRPTPTFHELTGWMPQQHQRRRTKCTSPLFLPALSPYSIVLQHTLFSVTAALDAGRCLLMPCPRPVGPLPYPALSHCTPASHPSTHSLRRRSCRCGRCAHRWRIRGGRQLHVHTPRGL
jgi:hypothetical protein